MAPNSGHRIRPPEPGPLGPGIMASAPPVTTATVVATYLFRRAGTRITPASSCTMYRCRRVAVSSVVAAKQATMTAMIPTAIGRGTPVAAIRFAPPSTNAPTWRTRTMLPHVPP